MKIGMGWVRWTEEQTLAADMQSIETAYLGVHEMLSALAGREIPHAKADVDPPQGTKMTTELMMAMFAGNR